MLRKWLVAISMAVPMLAVTASASASAPTGQVAAFKKADAAFAGPNLKWSRVLEQPHPTVAGVAKASAAFLPAVRAFDTALQKIGFSGKTGQDIAAVVKLNDQLIPVLGHVTSLKQFESGVGPLVGRFAALQTALSKDLGIPAADIIL